MNNEKKLTQMEEERTDEMEVAAKENEEGKEKERHAEKISFIYNLKFTHSNRHLIITV